MKLKESIGLIGVGNMGTAILEGLFQKKIVSSGQVWVYDKISEKADDFAKQWKVNRAPSNAEVVRRAEVILLAIKPQDLPAMAEEWKNSLRPSHVLISILAGTPLDKIRRVAGEKLKIVRAMPNLGAKVGQAITALAGTDAHALSLAEVIFSGCGKTVRLTENYFDLVTAVSGSGPAYFFFLMGLLMREGIQNGLSEKDAQLLAVQTAVGAGLLAQSAAVSPEELRKMVTSKGGTTEAALKVLEANHFPKIFHEAIEAAIKRGRELAQG